MSTSVATAQSFSFGNAFPIRPSSQAALPWNELFSGLLMAEMAAARHAEMASSWFSKAGNHELSKFYASMAKEEHGHADLVENMIGAYIAPPKLAVDVYAGKRCRLPTEFQLLERLVIIHLIFEPSAIAILSFIQSRAKDLFETGWARKVRSSAAKILKEEASHIRRGGLATLAELEKLPISLRRELSLSMRTHELFLRAGIKRMFGKTEFSDLVPILLKRFDIALDAAKKGKFHEAI